MVSMQHWKTLVCIISARLQALTWRLSALACLSLLLTACSAVGLAYSNSTTALYWWLDAQFDLNERQTALVRKELDGLYAWHRREELPDLLRMLARWEQLSAQALTTEQVCTEFEQARSAMERLTRQGMSPLSRLGLLLEPAQVDHLAKHQKDKRQEFADDNLRGSEQAQFERRLDKLEERYEDLYGSLSDPQLGILQQGLKSSPFNAQRSMKERERRDQDLRETLTRVRAASPAPAETPMTAAQASQAIRLMTGWHDRAWRSPTPGYQAYARAITNHGCALFASVHASTTAEQRQHAAEVLKGYREALADQALPVDASSGAMLPQSQ